MAGTPCSLDIRRRFFPHLRYEDKLMDNSSKENERLNTSKIRGAGDLENA